MSSLTIEELEKQLNKLKQTVAKPATPITPQEKLKQERVERLQRAKQQKRLEQQIEQQKNQTAPQPTDVVNETKMIDESEDLSENEAKELQQIRQEQNKGSVPLKSRWNQKCEIYSIQIPSIIPKDSLVKKRKYQIRFQFRDESGKIRDATVRFGSVKNQDYIDTLDLKQRNKSELRFKNLNNPLDPNFWRHHLCNTEQTLMAAYCKFIQESGYVRN